MAENNNPIKESKYRNDIMSNVQNMYILNIHLPVVSLQIRENICIPFP